MKVGDQVKVIHSIYNNVPVGTIGVIDEISFDLFLIRVLRMSNKVSTYWHFYEKELELVTDIVPGVEVILNCKNTVYHRYGKKAFVLECYSYNKTTTYLKYSKPKKPSSKIVFEDGCEEVHLNEHLEIFSTNKKENIVDNNQLETKLLDYIQKEIQECYDAEGETTLDNFGGTENIVTVEVLDRLLEHMFNKTSTVTTKVTIS